jgi:hypothetical protein
MKWMFLACGAWFAWVLVRVGREVFGARQPSTVCRDLRFSRNRNRRRHTWLPMLFSSGQIRRVA